PDGTSHVVGPRGPEALRAYRDNDCRLGQVLAKIPAEVRAKMAIFFVSDHGMGPMDKSNPRNTDDVFTKEQIQAVEDGGFIYLLNLRAQLSSGTPAKGVESSLTYLVTDDDTGAPVPGAKVTLTSGSRRVEGTTGSDGKVALTIAPETGQLVFEASASGFNAARLTHDLSSAQGARTPGTGSPASLVLAGLAALGSSACMRRARARIQHRNTR
ncbi:MAG: alkaline phosphatase family protein, partial [Actinomycetota bacterium]